MKKILSMAALAAGMLAFAASANAVTVTTYIGGEGNDKNDCSGLFGQGFENCKSPSGSPIIAKADYNKDAGTWTWSINSIFTTITGLEFNITNNGDGTGSFTYTMGAGDPFLTAFVAKGGPSFNLFTDLGDAVNGVYTFNWNTPVNPNNPHGKNYGISHLSFYDTKNPGGGGGGPGGEVPLPAALPLLLSGIAGLGWLARRKAA